MAREELAPARSRKPEDVLHVRNGSRHGAQCRRAESSMTERHEREHADAGPRLEAPRGDVAVRDPVAQQVQHGPGCEGPEARIEDDTRRRAARDVERDDHLRLLADRIPESREEALG
jgi:hypothetical protein